LPEFFQSLQCIFKNDQQTKETQVIPWQTEIHQLEFRIKAPISAKLARPSGGFNVMLVP
jgi:hypothetical protein